MKRQQLVSPAQANYEALVIAKHLFSLDPKREYFSNSKTIKTGTGLAMVLLGNWRLNQMLYLLQTFHYVKYGNFLFQDNLYAFDNGFIVYDVYRDFWALYDKAWFLHRTKDNLDKKTKDFVKMIFFHFKDYPNQRLEDWYTHDPTWANSWLEKKKEPKVEFDAQSLRFYKNFYSNHLHHIEHHHLND